MVPFSSFSHCLFRCVLDYLEEEVFGLSKSLSNGCYGVSREAFLLNDELVKVVSQKVGARSSAVAIVHREE
jgi:hypothetical protein